MGSSSDASERDRRLRAARLLGELMPDITSDERDDEAPGHGKGGTSASARRDDEMMRDVPPHHGS